MKVVTKSERETFNLGKRLGRRLKKGDIVALEGGLGAGKTIFVKGVAEAFGFDKDKVVSSSFVLIREYKARLPLYHFDLYRLENKYEFVDLGYEEYFFGDGICLVEWADKVDGLIPKEAVRISFKLAGKDRRRIEYSGV